MSKPLASVEFVDGIAVITIDNPPVNNISIALRGDLHTVFDQIAATAGVHGALVVCAGNTFVSGADISEFSGPPQEEAYRELFFRTLFKQHISFFFFFIGLFMLLVGMTAQGLLLISGIDFFRGRTSM
jgi:enoyl-CoA hydratase/carnithine racemase